MSLNLSLTFPRIVRHHETCASAFELPAADQSSFHEQHSREAHPYEFLVLSDKQQSLRQISAFLVIGVCRYRWSIVKAT